MALDQVLQNAAARLSTNNQLQQQIGAALVSALYPDLLATALQLDTQLLNPAINTELGDTINGFVSGAARYGLNPHQWYNQLVGIYRQPMFGYGLGNSNLVYAIYLLSALYVDLQKSRDRNAQIHRIIVGNLLVEILYHYYRSIGQDPSKQLIKANINQLANVFNGGHMGALNLVYSNALLRTWDPLFAQSAYTLASTLDGITMSTIRSLINTMYSRVQIPQVVGLILNEFGQNGLYMNMFDYIFNRKIGSYISQAMQQTPQQAGQHQGRQQANQPQQPQGQSPPLVPAGAGGQGNNPLGQQAQPGNQLVPPPQPVVIMPQNQQPPQQAGQHQGRQQANYP